MSPRLDMPLDRREAVSALPVMLAAVMGLGALPELVEATEPVPELDDCFLGYVDGKQWAGKMSGPLNALVMAPFEKKSTGTQRNRQRPR